MLSSRNVPGQQVMLSSIMKTFPAEFLNVDFDVKSRIAAALRESVFRNGVA
jgi:hypothetical protein